MTTTVCDLCGVDTQQTGYKVRVRDGEHPHNGSTMYSTIDVCYKCMRHIPDLESAKELEELQRAVK